jgi:hypothetical protein
MFRRDQRRITSSGPPGDGGVITGRDELAASHCARAQGFF